MAGERLQVTQGATLGKQVAVDGDVVIGRTAGANGGLEDDRKSVV